MKKTLTSLLVATLILATVFSGCENSPKELKISENQEVATAEIVMPTYEKASKSKVSKKSSKKSNKKPELLPKKVNDKINIEDNVFLDALEYTGYSVKKTRKDGYMWIYVLCSSKPGRGWLSDITYGGGATGLEKTSKGKPDIKAFERGGLVCASFATYVYFNYLPNVAGIDTSHLKRPHDTHLANDWKIAAEDWVKKGYSHKIKFSEYVDGSGYIHFSEKSYMPIGSILLYRDAKASKSSKTASHVAIYIGKKNGYHWCIHVGNENGPEMCATERMNFGPDPQASLEVISTPRTIRLSADVNVTLTKNGKPKKGVKLYGFKKGEKKVYLGKTDKNGKLSKSGVAFGKYTIKTSGGKKLKTVKLTAKNKSVNNVNITWK